MTSISDFLVIGSGIAGLRFAIHAAKVGSVTIITKKDSSESNTNYAQGGIASVLSSDDNYKLHVEDTLVAGAGLCNKKNVNLLVKNGPSEILDLLNLGVNFTTKSNGDLDLAKEGGHTKHRIVHSKDLTGKEVEQTLLKLVKSDKNIQILENMFAIDLITQHNIKKMKSNQPLKCFGCFVFNSETKKVERFLSKFTILATGGLGQAYMHTTNPEIATGDGYAMAYRAGALMSNMEFIQFHPTSLWEHTVSNKHNKKSFLISEAIRGHGAILLTQNGNRFMANYDSRKELAPRDIVARAIDAELKKSGDDFVLLDISFINSLELINYFPNIYNYCLKLNIDITKQSIPIVPAAHYCCGGIKTNSSGGTNISNLYAIGEVADTGVHGANRLASNSLLEALVFSRLAFKDILKLIKKVSVCAPELVSDWDSSGTTSPDELILLTQSKLEIKQILWDYVGIVRTNLRLERAKNRLEMIKSEVNELYKRLEISDSILELRNLVDVANLITTSAIKRKESRGLHYNLDYNYLLSKAKETIIENFSK